MKINQKFKLIKLGKERGKEGREGTGMKKREGKVKSEGGGGREGKGRGRDESAGNKRRGEQFK